MMLLTFIVALVLASVAACLSINTSEEIVQVAAAVTAGICLFFSLIFAPIAIKLMILLSPLFSKKIQLVASRSR
ncbi:MAG: hypothetical protein KME06_11305 [Kastovskya adunca ATA6-11-RM4]|nr:hypothetical protein [Kastovskya adunca ATA6-11-RM4]